MLCKTGSWTNQIIWRVGYQFFLKYEGIKWIPQELISKFSQYAILRLVTNQQLILWFKKKTLSNRPLMLVAGWIVVLL